MTVKSNWLLVTGNWCVKTHIPTHSHASRHTRFLVGPLYCFPTRLTRRAAGVADGARGEIGLETPQRGVAAGVAAYARIVIGQRRRDVARLAQFGALGEQAGQPVLGVVQPAPVLMVDQIGMAIVIGG